MKTRACLKYFVHGCSTEICRNLKSIPNEGRVTNKLILSPDKSDAKEKIKQLIKFFFFLCIINLRRVSKE